ncbi:MAG TPA: NADH-quinone oxidoreductase subunit NuoN [Hyphomicrobiales bacterium]|nr:NADH-quinone oxidoreductase subunit NuoN [Hyphomicrobiales bacterium]
MTFSAAELLPILPELITAVGALLLILLGAIAGERATPLVNGLAVALLVAAAIALGLIPEHPAPVFHGAFVFDAFSRFLQLLIVVGALVALAMSFYWLKLAGIARFEYAVLVLLATTGMMVMAAAGDLIAFYLGLELQNLALYVVAAFDRDSERSTEAGLKYFVLGALSSGMILYGASLAYGFSGTVDFAGIAAVVGAGHVSTGLIFGLVFLLAGLAFKVSAAPFHMWTPDVYEGAPTPITIFFSTAPKIAAMAIIVRLVVSAFPGITQEWREIMAFLAVISTVLAAFAAIGQRNIKRLMGYSSVANIGYMLIGLAAGTQQGVASVLIYLAIYLAMSLGTFAVILAMRRPDGGMVENIDDLAGLAKTQPWMAFAMATMMFSIAGIPPLAGFFAKLYVFMAAVQAGLYWLAVVGVVASVVGAYYYLRIVKIMYFDEPAGSFQPMPAMLRAVLTVTGIFIVFYFVYPAPLTAAAATAARSLF